MSAVKKGGREKVEMTLAQFQGGNMTLAQFHGGNITQKFSWWKYDTYAIPGWKYEERRGGGEPLDERLLEPNRHSAERLKKKTT